MSGRLTVRNLEDDVLSRLGELAKINERSVESEVRYALKRWTEPRKEMTVYQHFNDGIGMRLSLLMENKNYNLDSPLKVSHISEMLGCNNPSTVAKWIEGEEEPTFKELEKLAELFAVSPKWLKHGDGSPFMIVHEKMPHEPKEAVTWLLKEERYRDLKNIAFVRTTNGNIYIVKIYDKEKSIVYKTQYNLYGSMRNDDCISQINFFNFLEELYNQYIPSHEPLSKILSDILIHSYVFDDQDSNRLTTGFVDPLSIIYRHSNIEAWWEDVWQDASNLREYWTGCKELCLKINENKIKTNQ